MRYKITRKEALYGSGGFYDTMTRPEEIESVDELGDDSIEYLAELFPGGSYRRSEPNIVSTNEAFTEKITSLFKYISENFSYCAPSLALRAKEGYIHDSVIYLGSPEGLSIFYPTLRDNDRPFVRLLDLERTDIGSCKDINNNKRRRFFFLGSAGSFNYGHWLVDDLPRIKWLLRNPQPTTILLQSFPGMDDIRTQSLNLLLSGSGNKLLFLHPDDVTHCSDLTYVTPISFHPYIKSMEALNFLRDAVRSKLTVAPTVGDRIFIRRRPDRGRRILNITEIEGVVASLGFTIFDPENFTFANQANMFAKAKIIVGTMCAAMCNSAFCAIGTELLYLAPNDWVEPFYWDLANVLGHSYTAIHGERAYANDAPHLDDFHVDAQTLKSTLLAMIFSQSV